MDASRRERAAGGLLLAGLGAAVAALALFAWLADFVVEGAAIPFDTSVRGWVHLHSSAGLTAVMRAMSFLGEPGSLMLLSGVAVLLLLHAARWPRAASLFIVTMLGGFVLDSSLKGMFHRLRPESFFHTPLPHSYSFPSGHALFSVCFWGVLAALASARVRRTGLRVAIWAAAALIAGLIGYSRIYLGVHYPSDVLAGYSAAVVWVAAVASADRVLQRRRARRQTATRTPA